jgi:hypothetical protein
MRLREEKEGNSWQLLKEFWQAISAGFKYCGEGGRLQSKVINNAKKSMCFTKVLE